jgi:predicted dehydrogenase
MRFVIAGLGSAGQRHVRNLRQLAPEARGTAWRVRGINVVLDDHTEAEHGRSPEAAYGLRAVARLDDALSDRPDAVIIANPIAMHCETALAAAKAGCALLIEKPLSDRWDGVDELMDRCRKSGRPAVVGYQMRFHPALRQVKAWLDDGRIGTPLSAQIHFGEYLPGMHPYEDYRTSHAARKAEGGGVILCLSHEIDLAQWLFGMPASVRATGGHFSDLEIDVEDTAVMEMDCAWEGRRLPVTVSLDFIQQPARRSGEITGDRGAIRWDLIEPSASLREGADGAWDARSFPGFRRNQMFLDEMAQFLRCMDSGETPEVTIESGARTLRIALAAKASLEAGRPVPVTDLLKREAVYG